MQLAGPLTHRACLPAATAHLCEQLRSGGGVPLTKLDPSLG